MRVLVIDDDPGVRVLCRIAFRTEGDEIIEAASGREGLELLETETVDAVVLDVMLPSVNGFEVLRRIRKDARMSDLPVVLLSVRVGIRDQIDGWRAGRGRLPHEAVLAVGAGGEGLRDLRVGCSRPCRAARGSPRRPHQPPRRLTAPAPPAPCWHPSVCHMMRRRAIGTYGGSAVSGSKAKEGLLWV